MGGEIRTVALPYGLDYGAAIAFAERIGADNSLFFELLPQIEGLIVRSHRRAEDDT